MILIPGAAPSVSDLAWGRVYSCDLPALGRAEWALLADTHVAGSEPAAGRGGSAAARLRRVVAEVLDSGPYPAVVNGDLACSRGEAEDYSRFLEIVEPLAAGPGLVLSVGNHDHRNNLLKALGEPAVPVSARLAATVSQGPYRFILLDSLVGTGEVGGEIGNGQLEWLEGSLSGSPSQQTFLFVHHPGRSASKGCADFDALADIAERHGCVQAIVTGHEHEYAIGEERGAYRIGLPATAFPFEAGVPCGWVRAALSSSSINLRFHGSTCGGNRSLAWR